MARTKSPRADESPAKKPLKAKSPATPNRRATILSLKGTAEWDKWLTYLADEYGTTRAGIIDRALRELAERGEKKKAPKR